MAEVRVGKERDVTRGGDRCQPDLEPRAVRPGEREVERPDGVCHSEPVEDLGAQEEVRQQPTEVRSVVVRDERPYEGGYLPYGRPLIATGRVPISFPPASSSTTNVPSSKS